jgi:hypothetical protein
VKSDLLAVAVQKKLGESPNIGDFFTGGSCRFREEGGLLRHPGRDGKYGTKDDITLGKKPNT